MANFIATSNDTAKTEATPAQGYIKIKIANTLKDGSTEWLNLKSRFNYDVKVEMPDALKGQSRKAARVIEAYAAQGKTPAMELEFVPVTAVNTADEDEIIVS